MRSEVDGAGRLSRERERWRLKKARQRDRKKPDANRPVTIRITIQDPELWRRACEAGDRRVLIAITERVIDEDCRERKRQESDAIWEKLSKTRTGIMDREAACANLDENGSWHISDRRERPPAKPKVKPDDMTEEEWD